MSDESKVVFRVTNLALAIARLFMWRLRPLRYGLAHRHAMIDHLTSHEEPDRVLELAAGLSRRGLSMSENPALTFVEVDLPHVMSKKEALIIRNSRVSMPDNLVWIAEDVRTFDLRHHLADSSRRVVISEGLVMYLNAVEQASLWSRISEALRSLGGGIYLFDFVPTSEQPQPGMIGRILEWLMKRWTQGKAFERDERSRENVRQALLKSGFDQVEWYEPHDVAQAWSLPFPQVSTQQLVFRCVVGANGRCEDELAQG